MATVLPTLSNAGHPASRIHLDLSVRYGWGFFNQTGLNAYVKARADHIDSEPFFSAYNLERFAGRTLPEVRLSARRGIIRVTLSWLPLPEESVSFLTDNGDVTIPYRLTLRADELWTGIGVLWPVTGRFRVDVGFAGGYGWAWGNVPYWAAYGTPLFYIPYSEVQFRTTYLPVRFEASGHYSLSEAISVEITAGWRQGIVTGFTYPDRKVPMFRGHPLRVDWTGWTLSCGLILTDILH